MGTSDVAGWTVGALAGRLGVAPATLRSWERRYGLGASGRSAGGHRRYTAADVATLTRMQRLVLNGESPARAARRALAEPPEQPAVGVADPRVGSPDGAAAQRGGPGGADLAVPGAGSVARGLARAASRLDVDATEARIAESLSTVGTVETWRTLLQPVLVAAGERWARTGTGIETEHLLSEAAISALRAYRANRPVGQRRPVLLSCAPGDEHALPLHVLAAALAERALPVRLLGARVPTTALVAAARRINAAGIFIWAQFATCAAEVDLTLLPETRPATAVVVGGPGWQGRQLPAHVHRAASLPEAVRALADQR